MHASNCPAVINPATGVYLPDTTDSDRDRASNVVTASGRNLYFEYGCFDWPGFEDRRVVYSSHIISMVEWASASTAEGWHEGPAGLTEPSRIGSVLMTPAGIPFHARGKAGQLKVARLLFRSCGDDLDMLSRELDASRLKDCLDIRCHDVIAGMRRLVRETAAPGFASDIALDALGALILVDAVRYLRRSPPPARAVQRLSRRDVRRIGDYVAANLARRITVSELAALTNMSERHFMRLFRATTGETVYRFVERQRFEKARLLLDEQDRPLKQIAHLLGFSSRVGFTLAFRRMAGQSPLEYRRRARRD